MIEIIKTILIELIFSMSHVIWFLISATSAYLPESLMFPVRLVLLIIYLTIVFIMGRLTIKFFKKKRYWFSIPCFIIFLIMLFNIVWFFVMMTI